MNEPKSEEKTPAQAGQAARANDPGYAVSAQAAAMQNQQLTEADAREATASLGDPMPAKGPGGRRPAMKAEEPKGPQIDTNALASAIVAAQLAMQKVQTGETKADADETVPGGLFIVAGQVVNAHGELLTEKDVPKEHAENLPPRVKKQISIQSGKTGEGSDQPKGE